MGHAANEVQDFVRNCEKREKRNDNWNGEERIGKHKNGTCFILLFANDVVLRVLY